MVPIPVLSLVFHFPFYRYSLRDTQFCGVSLNDLSLTLWMLIDIFYAVSDNNGLNWTDPACLNPNCMNDTNTEEFPIIIFSGGIWTAYYHSDGPACCEGGDSGGDLDVVYVTSIDNGQTWSNPMLVDEELRSDPPYTSDRDPRVVLYSSISDAHHLLSSPASK